MIGRNFHSVDKIETMRVESLHARIKFKMFALTSVRWFDQPGQELTTETERAVGCARN
jgi:hypothetical protein